MSYSNIKPKTADAEKTAIFIGSRTSYVDESHRIVQVKPAETDATATLLSIAWHNYFIINSVNKT